jgi:adenylosuccinate lyase
LIERYTRKEMGGLWSLDNKFQKMMEVEVAVAQAQAELGIIPKKAAIDIAKKSSFSVKRIAQIEKKTKHDVIAFVSSMAENVGENGRYIHFGMTSSDVLDTAMSLLIREAGELIKKDIQNLKKALTKQIKKYKLTLCSGRTHGMHAEPLSFGLKLSGFLAELQRNEVRFNTALNQCIIGKLSGAVGTYSTQSQEVEKKVCRKLKLKAETIATQVIPRDRHAELFHSISMLGCGLERLSVELRHLQRTEVGEVSEGFSKGQKGSSAMPHKKNPISSENLTGIARLLRSYSQAANENIALWHERDISHSSVERVIFPDAFILCDYSLSRMAGVVENLVVDKKQMLKNMDISKGQLFSSHLLLEIVKKGVSREDAYSIVQKVSHDLKEGEHLSQALLRDKVASQYLSKKDVDYIFSGATHKKGIEKVVNQFLTQKR